MQLLSCWKVKRKNVENSSDVFVSSHVVDDQHFDRCNINNNNNFRWIKGSKSWMHQKFNRQSQDCKIIKHYKERESFYLILSSCWSSGIKIHRIFVLWYCASAISGKFNLEIQKRKEKKRKERKCTFENAFTRVARR